MSEFRQRMRLQTKILAGYLVLVAVICSMAAILVHERGRMREIEAETGEIQEIRRDINLRADLLPFGIFR